MEMSPIPHSLGWTCLKLPGTADAFQAKMVLDAITLILSAGSRQAAIRRRE